MPTICLLYLKDRQAVDMSALELHGNIKDEQHGVLGKSSQITGEIRPLARLPQFGFYSNCLRKCTYSSN